MNRASQSRPAPLVLGAMFLLGFALVGCAGDDEPTLTKADFTEQANAICGQSNQEIGQIVGQLFSAEDATEADQQAVLDQIVTISDRVHDDLAALVPPKDMQGDVDQMLEMLSSGTDEAEGQGGTGFFQSDDNPWAEANALAGELGLDACAG